VQGHQHTRNEWVTWVGHPGRAEVLFARNLSLGSPVLRGKPGREVGHRSDYLDDISGGHCDMGDTPKDEDAEQGTFGWETKL